MHLNSRLYLEIEDFTTRYTEEHRVTQPLSNSGWLVATGYCFHWQVITGSCLTLCPPCPLW
jgi:hypothetical protein